MIVDYILGAMVAEAVALFAYRAATGRGPRPLAANLAAGAALLVAWRASDSGAPFPVVGAALGVALLANGVDLAQRWRSL